MNFDTKQRAAVATTTEVRLASIVGTVEGGDGISLTSAPPCYADEDGPVGRVSFKDDLRQRKIRMRRDRATGPKLSRWMFEQHPERQRAKKGTA